MTNWARCESCNASIRWGVTVDGIRMPLNVEPSLNGCVWIYPNHADSREKAGKLRVLDIHERQHAREGNFLMYTPHHATCPGVGRHRVPRSQTAFNFDN